MEEFENKAYFFFDTMSVRRQKKRPVYKYDAR